MSSSLFYLLRQSCRCKREVANQSCQELCKANLTSPDDVRPLFRLVCCHVLAAQLGRKASIRFLEQYNLLKGFNIEQLAKVTLCGCRKQHTEAAKSFRQASLALPGDARPLFRLGTACFAAGLSTEAQQAFREALAVAELPADAALLPKVHVNLGIALEALGQMSEACQHYR